MPNDAVLVLLTKMNLPPIVPLLIDPAGGSTNITFEYLSDTEVYWSCSTVWKNDMIVFGGSTHRDQVSRVESCTLKRIGTLAFSFNVGACTSTPADDIYLCFDNKLINGCRVGSEPTGNYAETERAFYGHYNTRIAASTTEILAVGQFRDGQSHANVEKIELGMRTWKPLLAYPFAESMAQAPILYHTDSFYHIS